MSSNVADPTDRNVVWRRLAKQDDDTSGTVEEVGEKLLDDKVVERIRRKYFYARS